MVVTPDDFPVSVILVAYHGDRWLPACLESLAAASRHRLHLVLLDNGGNARLDKLDLSAFSAERLQSPRPLGFAEANNFALVNARQLGRVVLFLNQDTISTPAWIDRCLDLLRQEPDIGAVSPLLTTYEQDGWDPGFLECLPGKALPPLEGGPFFFTERASAAALLVRSEALRQVGPFDPLFESYYEDFDLCRRLRAAGYSIAFARDAMVRHYGGSSTETLALDRRRMRLILRNRIIHQLRKNPENRLMPFLRMVATDLPRRLARGLAKTPSSQPPAVTLQAYADLLWLAPRLLSTRRDERAWNSYLDQLGWPPRQATPKPVA